MSDAAALPKLESPSARLGQWWFKNRSLSPIPLFLLMVVLPGNFVPSGLWILIPALGALIAESLRLWAVGYAGSATRTRGDRVPQLVHAGPYRWVRNPLYIANILLYTSCSLLYGFTYLSGVVFVYSCLQYTFIVRFEEEILSQSFGDQYRDYRARVPRWLVGTKRACEGSDHQFNFSGALRSERSTLMLVGVMTAILVLKRSLF